jgi:ABC-type cobalamin/Fe3+-siderophores transport system ATPase subunit
VLKKIGPEDRTKTNDALDHLNITDLADTLYSELSGGQKQRTLIARALASDPSVLILDEPTDGLDMHSQNVIMDLITHFHREHRLTIILVSHHLNVVANRVNRIALLEGGLFQIGPLEEILTEENLGKIYDMPVSIRNFEEERIIIAGREV